MLTGYKESNGEDKKIGITAAGNWIIEVGPRTELLDRPTYRYNNSNKYLTKN